MHGLGFLCHKGSKNHFPVLEKYFNALYPKGLKLLEILSKVGFGKVMYVIY